MIDIFKGGLHMSFKKIIAPVLSVVLLASGYTSVSATDDLTISIDSVTAYAGENFEVNVNLSGIPDSGISGIDFAVKYDSSVVTISSVTEGETAKTGATDVSGEMAGSSLTYSVNSDTSTVDFIWLTGLGSEYHMKNDGVFVTISGKIAENVTGETALEIIPITRGDISGSNSVIYAAIGENADLVKPSVSNGVISIQTPVVEETTVTEPLQTEPVISEDTFLGDADLNGVIDIRDLTVVNQHVVRIEVIEGQAYINADVIIDGEVGINDLSQIKKFNIKVIDSFVVEN